VFPRGNKPFLIAQRCSYGGRLAYQQQRISQEWSFAQAVLASMQRHLCRWIILPNADVRQKLPSAGALRD
jgi:hypothetical protein